MKILFLILALLLPSVAQADTFDQAVTFDAKVVRVVDGDTVDVQIPSWADTPFGAMSLRIYGIDTPESLNRFAKCPKELSLGLAAKAFAKTLAKPGDAIKFIYLGHDKYFRIDAKVILPSGQSWADIMIGNGMAAPYLGGTKKDWCS